MNQRKSEKIESFDDSSKTELTGIWSSAELLIDRYSHCVHCGSLLHFNHVTDFAQNLTHEVARCPECGKHSRQSTHILQ